MTILIRGGGDLATGMALRLFHAGFPVVITELHQPLAVRRTVSFAEAVYRGEWTVEGVTACKVDSISQVDEMLKHGKIPVLIAPELDSLKWDYSTLVDARLTKKSAGYLIGDSPLIIGLGPGFTAGINCHAAVETNRGHTLGRVYWEGSPKSDTAVPEGDPNRVLRAPADGIISSHVEIGQHVESGQVIASIEGKEITSPLTGIVRGLIHPGLQVTKGLKIGDVDSRDDPDLCRLVSDKALAVGGGVLEAILSHRK